ncbi:MAG: hypothetical protein JW869_03035 [Candidatus Omnitrophica bacterium]|nr:hypothetical protein [Candidatus Omnitrophota bacterium]
MQRVKIVALIGADGAGKTTTAFRLKDYLEAKNRQCRVLYMGRGKNRALPGARAIAKKAGLNLPRPQELHDLKGAKKTILCFLRDIAYMFDAYARYLVFILPSLRKGEMIITDRYAYDILLNEDHHALIKFLLLRLYPKPDYLFYLYNDPDILIARKDERTFRELTRHINVLKSLKEKFARLNYTNVYELKTDKVDQTLEEIIRLIERNQNGL